MLRFVSLMETYLCSVSSFIRKLNAVDPELRRICSLHDLNITQSMDTQQNQDDYKKELSCLCYSGKAKYFRNVSTEFSSFSILLICKSVCGSQG